MQRPTKSTSNAFPSGQNAVVEYKLSAHNSQGGGAAKVSKARVPPSEILKIIREGLPYNFPKSTKFPVPGASPPGFLLRGTGNSSLQRKSFPRLPLREKGSPGLGTPFPVQGKSMSAFRGQGKGFAGQGKSFSRLPPLLAKSSAGPGFPHPVQGKSMPGFPVQRKSFEMFPVQGRSFEKFPVQTRSKPRAAPCRVNNPATPFTPVQGTLFRPPSPKSPLKLSPIPMVNNPSNLGYSQPLARPNASTGTSAMMSGGDSHRLPSILKRLESAKNKAEDSEREQESAEKLRLELHRSRLDREAAERKIARLARKVGELEDSKNEKKEMGAGENQLHKTVSENLRLKKNLGIDDSGKEGFDKEDRDALMIKVRDLTTRCTTLSENYKTWAKQFQEYQHQMMDALGVTDEDLCRSVANGGIGESSKTCGPLKLHTYLRTNVEKLLSDYNGLGLEIQSLRLEHNAELLKSEGLAKHVETLLDEKKRMHEGIREHESRIEYLSREIKTLRNFLDNQRNKDAEARVKMLEQEKESLNQDLIRERQEWAAKITHLEREVEHERKRYDTLDAQSIEDREEIEKRWQKLWESHSQRMKDEVDVLKLNYEAPLIQSQAREESLKTQISELQSRYNKNKEAWEEYRVSIFKQMEQWKEQYIIKCELIDELRSEKEHFEDVLSEKQTDLDECRVLVNDGVLERLDLQKKINGLQAKLRELMGMGVQNAASEESLKMNLGALTSQRTWFSLGEFRKLRETLQEKPSGPKDDDENEKRFH